MSFRGNPKNLREFAKQVQALPKKIGIAVAAKAAPELTRLTQSAYDGGTTVYGDARPAGEHGALDLVLSGDVRGDIGFTAQGDVVRAVLPQRYAKYLVGKYRILPNGALPAAWGEALGRIVRDAASAELSR